MRSSTAHNTPDHEIERARPLLGTLVRIRVAGLRESCAHSAIDAAFAEIAKIHTLMSFQEVESEINRLGDTMCFHPLDQRTRECLAAALEWARASDGAFDPVAAACDGSWRDVRLSRSGAEVARPVRIDLSGIAKGYAVDRACASLAAAGATGGAVNAGGDLRVFGDGEEAVALTPLNGPSVALTIADGALASSDPALAQVQGQALHRDGRTRAASPSRFVAVAAPRCADADALTKIVLAMGQEAQPLLALVGAEAYLCEHGEWSTLGARQTEKR